MVIFQCDFSLCSPLDGSQAEFWFRVRELHDICLTFVPKKRAQLATDFFFKCHVSLL